MERVAALMYLAFATMFTLPMLRQDSLGPDYGFPGLLAPSDFIILLHILIWFLYSLSALTGRPVPRTALITPVIIVILDRYAIPVPELETLAIVAAFALYHRRRRRLQERRL